MRTSSLVFALLTHGCHLLARAYSGSVSAGTELFDLFYLQSPSCGHTGSPCRPRRAELGSKALKADPQLPQRVRMTLRGAASPGGSPYNGRTPNGIDRFVPGFGSVHVHSL